VQEAAFVPKIAAGEEEERRFARRVFQPVGQSNAATN